MNRTTNFSFLLLLCALVLAACTPTPPPVNTVPTVTITSPADGASMWLGAAVALSATATDTEDGELSASVTWSSDVDGALDPGAGDVVLSAGQHVITASVTDAGDETATDSVAVTVNVAVGTHVVAVGNDLQLVTIENDALVTLSTASLPGGPFNAEHGIFSIIKHPDQPWLYAASLNQSDWGDARIDRFLLDGDDLTHDGIAFTYAANLVGIDCTVTDPVDTVIGDCAPVGMVFSPDGQTLYVDDDDLDGIHVFSVDAAGDLTFVSAGGDTDVHGLTIDPTGSYLYNGRNVIDVTGAVPTTVAGGSGGNSTTLVDLGGVPGLITALGTDDVAIYDLTDPIAPSEVDTFNVGTEQVRELALTEDLSRIVAVGSSSVAMLSFDGIVLSELDRYTPVAPTQYRSVGLTADGTQALVSWFGGPAVGGVDLFAIADNGTLTFVGRTDFPGRSRALFTLPGTTN